MKRSAAECRAILLAAGMGTRMRPLTDHMPKPMVEVGGKKLIDHALDWMHTAGLRHVIVNTHYCAPMLEDYLQARSMPTITISREDVLLETGGGIAKALPLLGAEPFFSANSDAICLNGRTHALARLVQAWCDETMDALLLLHKVEDAVGYDGKGDFLLGDDGCLQRKPAATSKAPYVFTGVQLLHPRLFNHAPQGAFSLNLLYNQGMEKTGRLPRIHGLVHDGQWLHVGEPAAIAQAEKYL